MSVVPLYATREALREAADYKSTARDDAKLDRALAAGSRSVDALCHRTFYPEIATRFYDWPNGQYARPWRVWLDANGLISVTEVSSGGVPVDLDTVLLEPNQYGPPFNRVELDISKSSGWVGGFTHQRDISITGLWGYTLDETAIGRATALDAAGTVLDVDGPASAGLGVGSLLRLDDERLIVTGRRQVDTGQTLAADLAAKTDQNVISVQDGAQFSPGEVVLVEGERLRIDDIAGTTLVVRRGWDGSTLAAHAAGVSVWAPRRLTVLRGVLGTVAAVHADGAGVLRWDPPPLATQLTIAEALVTAGLQTTAYAKTARTSSGSSSSSERPLDASGIEALRSQVYDAHGRKTRLRGV